ncbi:hypothetical protein SUGI_1255200 [Cryptomeria japonica]|uniref:Uncharacterized protein n=1 Tax=Cryptomeria japonica TaxID=3369 RepID=A0AAD3NND1_CRYJA|nr:hypothetical protein SUGI_1255200 [Cryptomeria japonica]
MHDHLRDLGREMALEPSRPHRLWHPQDLISSESMGLQTILAETNARCFHSILNERMPGIVTLFIGQSDTCVEMSTYLLFVELDNDFNQLDATRLLKLQHLRHDITEQPRIPSWTPFQNSRCLKIFGG